MALRFVQRGEIWLFDCGEATQHQLQHTDLKISQITRIFISHLHGDHIFGLTGLLATCGMAGHAQAMTIYAPQGLADYLDASLLYSRTRVSETLAVETVEGGLVYEDEEVTVTCAALKHRVPAFGYRITEKDRAGRFNVERAAALGIPSGPLFGRLKRGQSVTLPDGRNVNGADLCGPSEKGRSIVYCTDTIFCESAIELARAADVLIHEATFADEDIELARQSLHSTATMAAQVAASANVNQLVLTHLSPRYAYGNLIEAADLIRQARSIFPNTILAQDFMTLEVPRHRISDGKA